MAKKKRTVTVTGATGFVGRHLVQQLLQEGKFTVRCMVRPDSDISVLVGLGGDLTFEHGDILQPDSLVAAFKGAWGVVNLAGYREF